MINEKICSRCEILKPLTGFHKRSATPDGYYNTCKECRKTDTKKYYIENKDLINAKSKIYNKLIYIHCTFFKKVNLSSNLVSKLIFMPVFNDLSIEKKYLINEYDGDNVLLVEPIMKTESCVLILIHEDVESIIWKKLSDNIFEIIEELSEEKVEEYDLLFEEDEDDDFEIE